MIDDQTLNDLLNTPEAEQFMEKMASKGLLKRKVEIHRRKILWVEDSNRYEWKVYSNDQNEIIGKLLSKFKDLREIIDLYFPVEENSLTEIVI